MVAAEGVQTVIFKAAVVISRMKRMLAGNFREAAEVQLNLLPSAALWQLAQLILELLLPGANHHLCVTQSTCLVQQHALIQFVNVFDSLICFGRLSAASGVICLYAAGVEPALKHWVGARALSPVLQRTPSMDPNQVATNRL